MMRTVLVLLVLVGAGPARASLTVEADGIRSAEGQVVVAVCNRSFDEAGCPYGAKAKAEVGTVTFSFPDLPPGRYAIAVFHDLDGNGEIATMAMGIPTEPYGFSNDVGRLGPPNFGKALIDVGREPTVVRINVRKLLS